MYKVPRRGISNWGPPQSDPSAWPTPPALCLSCKSSRLTSVLPRYPAGLACLRIQLGDLPVGCSASSRRPEPLVSGAEDALWVLAPLFWLLSWILALTRFCLQTCFKPLCFLLPLWNDACLLGNTPLILGCRPATDSPGIPQASPCWGLTAGYITLSDITIPDNDRAIILFTIPARGETY